MKKLLLVTICGLYIAGCSPISDQKAPANSSLKKALVFTSEDSTSLSELLKKFTVEKDEFNNSIRYYHKSWGDQPPHRKTLIARVANEGLIYPISVYWSTDWIFHDRISIKCDSTVLESSFVKGSLNKTEVMSGHILEYVIYSEDSDTSLLKLVSDCRDKKISMRFHGREYYDDAVLTSADKNGISDCLQLSRMLKKRAAAKKIVSAM